jgi:hypothetical protein
MMDSVLPDRARACRSHSFEEPAVSRRGEDLGSRQAGVLMTAYEVNRS